ncbi:MAG: dihydropteroate synthase [Acidimicrobiia bacterium]
MNRVGSTRRWRIRGGELLLDHPLVMGVVNVTPDSFSDGGRFLLPGDAISRGMQLAAEGADLIDVGGESTRPGAEPVDASEELRRVIPVVESLASSGVLVSIDTSKATVASKAIEAGAVIINDVTAMSDPSMAGLVAELRTGLVLVHMQGIPSTMQADPHYDDVVAEVAQYLARRAQQAEVVGIDRASIAIDPGIGFGKNLEHNLTLLRDLRTLADLGYPVLVGTSRKAFLGKLTRRSDPEDRDLASAVSAALAIERGADVIRVHNVAVCKEAAIIAMAIVRGSGG